MKTKIALLTAAFAPLTLTAQTQPSPAATPATVEATRPQVSKRIPRLQFEDAAFSEIVDFTQKKAQELATAALENGEEADDFNVVIVPGAGIAEKRVPSLALRNVTPGDVLTVVTTILHLTLEAVQGEDGRRITWVVRDLAAEESRAGGGGGPVGAVAGGMPGAPVQGARVGAVAGGGADAGPGAFGGGASGGPVAVELAATSAGSGGLGGSGFGGQARKEVRVFGIAALISPKATGDEARMQERTQKYRILQDTLSSMAADQGGGVPEIHFYEAMEIVVVKSADPAVMALIAEAVDAMKSNVATSETADRSALELLRNLSPVQKSELLKSTTEIKGSGLKPER